MAGSRSTGDFRLCADVRGDAPALAVGFGDIGPEMRSAHLSLEEKHELMQRQSRGRIVVVGDVHGCYDSLKRVLQLAGLIDRECQWRAGPSEYLVICGDMIDEGAQSRQVVELVRTLQVQVSNQATALMGNHELLLLRALAQDPSALVWETVWSWADTDANLQASLERHRVPHLTTAAVRQSFQRTFMASGSAQYAPEYVKGCTGISKAAVAELASFFRDALSRDGTLAWLESLPVAMRQGAWGFFHGGPPSGFSGGIDKLNATFSKCLRDRRWQDSLLEPYSSPGSPIGTRRWMAEGEAAMEGLLASFGVKYVAFGHSPGAINGVFGQLDQRWDRAFKADAFFSLGVEGFLEILDDSVWAVYTEIGREVFSRVHPGRPELPRVALLSAIAGLER